MKLTDLGFSRTLQKDPVQTDETKDVVFTSSNPTPKSGQGNNSGGDQNRGNEKDDGSKNVLTGTRIISCFIQTSGLPSRVEIAGNDIKFFDDTSTANGEVTGDTARLVFTHDLNSNEGFIFEKRASVFDTYDNVLSIYATPAKTGRHNYFFLGRNATDGDQQRNLSVQVFSVNQDTSEAAPAPGISDQRVLNGVYRFEFSQDGVAVVSGLPLLMGSSKTLTGGALPNGFSSTLAAGYGGFTGLSYIKTADGSIETLIYLLDDTAIMIGKKMLPDGAGYNIGAPGQKFGTFYGSVSACPLPTVEDALEILDTIAEPVFVGDRGHYGDRKYFDDLGFPESLLWTNSDGYTDIEHNHMLGFLLKVVKELKSEIDSLKSRLPQ